MTLDVHTRRQILKAALAGTAGFILGDSVRLAAQGQAVETANPVRLADNLYVIRIPGQANVVAQTSAAGVTLVDGGSAAGSDALMKAVAAVHGTRVKKESAAPRVLTT